MAIRFLAPAHPIDLGRQATVRMRLTADSVAASTRWEWDDGEGGAAGRQADAHGYLRVAHRYRGPGVYRVQVFSGISATSADTRYVTVRGAGQTAGSGWIRDAASDRPVPFGFLLTPGPGDADVRFRCLVEDEELVSGGEAWLLSGDPGSLHFGGTARLDARDGEHLFRVDLVAEPDGARTQQLAISVYEPGRLPGHDSPLHRLSGRIRPGCAILASEALS